MENKINYVAYYRLEDNSHYSKRWLNLQKKLIRDYMQGDAPVIELIEVGSRDQSRALSGFIKNTMVSKNDRIIIAALDVLPSDFHFVTGIMNKGIIIISVDSPQDTEFLIHVELANINGYEKMIKERKELINKM